MTGWLACETRKVAETTSAQARATLSIAESLEQVRVEGLEDIEVIKVSDCGVTEVPENRLVTLHDPHKCMLNIVLKNPSRIELRSISLKINFMDKPYGGCVSRETKDGPVAMESREVKSFTVPVAECVEGPFPVPNPLWAEIIVRVERSEESEV